MSQQEPEDRIIADVFARLRSEDQLDTPDATQILNRKSEAAGRPAARRLLFVGATSVAAALTVVMAGFYGLVPSVRQEASETVISRSAKPSSDPKLNAPAPVVVSTVEQGVEMPPSQIVPSIETPTPAQVPKGVRTPDPAPRTEPVQSPRSLQTPRPVPEPELVTKHSLDTPPLPKGKATPAAPVERVTVVAAGPVVDLDNAMTAAQLSDDFIGNLPVAGNFYQNALTLRPGVNDADGGGNSDVHGSRSRDFKAIVAGVRNVDPLTGQFMVLVNQSTVDELEVITEGAGVEFGRAQGGFAIIHPGGQVVTLPLPEPVHTEGYNSIEENDFVNAGDDPLSTFSIDVDTASYSNARRFLTQGSLPPADSIRIEEWINYFDYDYPAPTGAEPFSVNLELGECPWNRRHLLAKIGLQADWVPRSETAGSNLVFLIDVSGSMNASDKLPLVKKSIEMLADELGAADRVAMVVYAGASGLVLESTSGTHRGKIRRALRQLDAGGGTAGAAGIRLAYQVARENFIEGGVNRVILATDGDFNVGVTGQAELLNIIQADADKGIFLTALGFGTGNLQDGRLEQLADKGNGNYAYIDSIHEARKVLVDELEGTLYTVAKDVKIQVEFNPLQVAGYRLIGYENRKLAHADFNDDTKDAGEIGSGHSVTALYEIVPAGEASPRPKVDPLKYQDRPEWTDAARSQEWMTVKLRYKDPAGTESKLIERVVNGEPRRSGELSADFDFAASVAAFGMLLRGSEFAGDATIESMRGTARRGSQRDPFGYRSEFVKLIDAATPLLNKTETDR